MNMRESDPSGPPLQVKTSPFQTKTSRFFEKFATIRVRRANGRSREEKNIGPYGRQPASLDMQQKPFMSQPSLSLHISENNNLDTDGSSTSSPCELSHRRSKRLSACDPITVNAKSDLSVPSRSVDGIDSHKAHMEYSLKDMFSTPSQAVAHTKSPAAPSADFLRDQGDYRKPETSAVHAKSSAFGGEAARRPRNPSPVRKAQHDTTRQHKVEVDQRHSGRTSSNEQITSSDNASRPIPNSNSSTTRRSAAPKVGNLPPPCLNRVGTARVTPSIITRTPPMSVHLPPLPQPTPQLSTPIQPRAALRIMPELPVRGQGEGEGEGEDISNTEDSDEEEELDIELSGTGDDMGSDDEGNISTESSQSYATPVESRSSSRMGRQRLATTVDTSRIDTSFLDRISESSLERRPLAEVDATPIATRPFDYFSDKPMRQARSSQSPPRTPRQGDTWLSPFASMQEPSAMPTRVPAATTKQPALYRLASKSMVDISSALKKPATVTTPSIPGAKGKAREPPATISHAMRSTPPEYKAIGAGSPSLRRMQSMPMFIPKSAPPPYPSFAPYPASRIALSPREDEGKEKLPPYTNSIYLCAMMPRKMEFVAPGVQAKDRKWRRVFCVLEGTAFKVYECPRGVAGVGALGEWWERRVGVGDVATPPNTARVEGAMPRETARPSKLGVDANGDTQSGNDVPEAQQSSRPASASGTNQTTLSKASVFLLPSRRKQRSRNDISPERPSSRSSMRNSRPPSRTGSNSTLAVSADGAACSSSSSSTRSHIIFGSRPSGKSTPHLLDSTLIRAYTMQNAESGLGNDYLKRKNVIRVRLEGEQFLLQAVDVAAVVEWIESLHAAANVALDLDERVMPKGPMIPRRRRRRVRRAEAEHTETGTNRTG